MKDLTKVTLMEVTAAFNNGYMKNTGEKEHFTEQTIAAKLKELNSRSQDKLLDPYLVDNEVSMAGAYMTATYLAMTNVDLLKLWIMDLFILYNGRKAAFLSLGNNEPVDTGTSNVFDAMSFEPNGTEPFYFPNGVRGISTLYLAEVSKELFNQGLLSGKNNPRLHGDITKKAREWMEEVDGNFHRPLEHSYYNLAEGKYIDCQTKQAKHVWMSPDLCLALAATDHKSVQMQVIDDLNRMTMMVNSLTGGDLPVGGLSQHLPGSTAKQEADEEFITIASGKRQGYITMAQVKTMWVDQGQGKNFDAFDKRYPWETIYKDLHDLSLLDEYFTRTTESHTGYSFQCGGIF